MAVSACISPSTDRPLYRRLRFVLFAVALLLPVFSALGFISMGRELSTNPAAAAAAQDYLGPAHADKRLGIARWHNQLIIGYFSIIGAAFGARAVRNMLERSRRRLVSISYPRRTVRVPRGWSVLEASRSFHLPHASMCGGRARCSTCRVRVTAGEEFCPPAGMDEEATLARIGASPDMRLACQLRPSRRHFGRPAGAHRAGGLPADGAAAQCRARGRRDVLRLLSTAMSSRAMSCRKTCSTC